MYLFRGLGQKLVVFGIILLSTAIFLVVMVSLAIVAAGGDEILRQAVAIFK